MGALSAVASMLRLGRKKAAEEAVDKLTKEAQEGTLESVANSERSGLFAGVKPPQKPQRPFDDDYVQGTQGPGGSALQLDIDGRPISPSALVVGRRVVGGGDEGVGGGGAHGLAGSLGVPVTFARRTGPPLNGDAGRFIQRGDQRNIYLANGLTPTQTEIALTHELGHAIESYIPRAMDDGGGRIPVDGVKKGLMYLYGDLNEPNLRRPYMLSPIRRGYKANVENSELWAEALRAYMQDPNYIKSAHPEIAARLREYVNTNPYLNERIHLNSVFPLTGGAAGAGALYDDLER